MKLLAGENNYITEVRENGSRFRFDYSQVYWNSRWAPINYHYKKDFIFFPKRLQQEHQRIVNLYAPYKEKSSTEDGHVICDVMAGVGPFSLPLAKRGLFVYCNDLNPQSYLWFLENIKLNKVSPSLAIFKFDTFV
jgi:tRNA (guanine37-N1)-methyltransferase